MLSDKTIMAFVATANPAKAQAFYEKTLGLPVKHSDPYAIVFDSNGIDLRMSIVKAFTPHPFSVLSWLVPAIEKEVKDLKGKGVVFEKYDFLNQDENDVWTAPDGTKVAWFKDPDGNLLSVTEYII